MNTRMLRIGLILTGILVISLVAGCRGGQPAIDLPQTQHDFGQIQPGQVATIQLPVRNTGEEDLHIESVSTSCGCTSAVKLNNSMINNGVGLLNDH